MKVINEGAVLWRSGLQFLITDRLPIFAVPSTWCPTVIYSDRHNAIFLRRRWPLAQKIACFMGGDNTSPMSCHPHLGVLIYRSSSPGKFFLFLYSVF